MNNSVKVSTFEHYKKDTIASKTDILLMRSMFALLKRKTFDKISVKDICNEALVSRSCFYSHFEDKYHLLIYCLEKLKWNISDTWDYNHKTVVLDKLLDYIQINGSVFKSLFAAETTLELRSMMISALSEEIEEFLDVKQIIADKKIPVSISTVSLFIAGGITQIIQGWVITDFKETKETISLSLDWLFLEFLSET